MKSHRNPKRKSNFRGPSPVKDIHSPPGRESFLSREWAVIQKHRTPQSVQSYLNHLPYNRERKGETLRTFRGVVAHGETHCLEAALAAATILEQHGYPPLLLDLESQDNLDHVLFLFKHRGCWGTVARSRDMALHGRRPVFRTLRQLVMSYVDPYVDWTARLTGYGVFDLRQLGRYDWRLSSKNVWAVEQALIKFPHKRLKTSDRHHKKAMARFLAFRKKYPHRPLLYFPNRHQWMGIPRPKFRT